MMSMAPKIIKPPLTDAVVRSLNAGDEVLITGTIYTARDAAHKRLCEAIADGLPLPFPLKGALIYFCGPTPAAWGKPIGSAGPTTSSRMDTFSPTLIAAGLKAMLGKGYRNQTVRDSLKQYCAVHFSTIGGAGALLAKHVSAAHVIAYEDLGPEAIMRLEVIDFPVVVAYDCFGNTVYK
jgi:fumarate hydratase subunit beta